MKIVWIFGEVIFLICMENQKMPKYVIDGGDCMVDEKLVDYILSRVNELENKVETLKGVVLELEYQVNSK